MNGQNAVGSPVARKKEDLRLITGHGTYVSNLQLPRMRHVAFGRSPLAHARIRSVDATAALAGAIGDALGVAVDRLPITPSRLWELML
jgi:CO/xanthine dehydrogenase Mo-binding subunit